jgi:hypothetical protein
LRGGCAWCCCCLCLVTFDFAPSGFCVLPHACPCMPSRWAFSSRSVSVPIVSFCFPSVRGEPWAPPVALSRVMLPFLTCLHSLAAVAVGVASVPKGTAVVRCAPPQCQRPAPAPCPATPLSCTGPSSLAPALCEPLPLHKAAQTSQPQSPRDDCPGGERRAPWPPAVPVARTLEPPHHPSRSEPPTHVTRGEPGCAR